MLYKECKNMNMKILRVSLYIIFTLFLGIAVVALIQNKEDKASFVSYSVTNDYDYIDNLKIWGKKCYIIWNWIQNLSMP